MDWGKVKRKVWYLLTKIYCYTTNNFKYTKCMLPIKWTIYLYKCGLSISNMMSNIIDNKCKNTCLNLEHWNGIVKFIYVRILGKMICWNEANLLLKSGYEVEGILRQIWLKILKKDTDIK